MVLATSSHAEARLVAQRILDEIRDYPFLYRSEPIGTVSAGPVACSELEAVDPGPGRTIMLFLGQIIDSRPHFLVITR